VPVWFFDTPSDNPLATPTSAETRREALAALEHDQWIVWAGAIMGSEPISAARRVRWEALMIPYTDLLEHQKDQDRKWADRILTLFPPENPRREAYRAHLEAEVEKWRTEYDRLRAYTTEDKKTFPSDAVWRTSRDAYGYALTLARAAVACSEKILEESFPDPVKVQDRADSWWAKKERPLA